MDELREFLHGNAALLVSALALLLTLFTARATRANNRLMVQPRLTTFTHTDRNQQTGITTLEVTLRNSGLGPAFIISYEVLFDGQAVKVDQPGDLFTVLQTATQAAFVPNQCYFSTLSKDYVMAKDASVVAAKVAILNAQPSLLEELKRFHLRVTFESAYEQRFIYDTRTHKTSASDLRVLLDALQQVLTALKFVVRNRLKASK